jgi:hypothetical protein
MKIRLEPIPIYDHEALTAACTPRRKSMAQSILNIHERSDDSLVVAVDGQWGSGKTVFLRYLEALSKGQGINVLYYDAFENDISEDAFASFSSFLYGHIEEDDKIKSKQFAQSAAIIGTKAITKIGGNALNVISSGLLNKEDFEDAISEIRSSGRLYENLENYIKSHSNRQNAKRNLKDAINACLGANSKSHPKGTLIIIDEIDRCRPDFAIETIECVKHLFYSNGITFVIGADFNELNKIVYGNIGALGTPTNYMEKFYDIRLQLEIDNKSREANHRTLYDAILKNANGSDYKHLQANVLREETNIFTDRGVSLRRYISFLQSYNLSCLMSAHYGMDTYDYIALISSIKYLDSDVYAKILNGSASFEDLSSIFSSSKCIGIMAVIEHIEADNGMYKFLQQLALEAVELGQS